MRSSHHHHHILPLHPPTSLRHSLTAPPGNGRHVLRASPISGRRAQGWPPGRFSASFIFTELPKIGPRNGSQDTAMSRISRKPSRHVRHCGLCEDDKTTCPPPFLGLATCLCRLQLLLTHGGRAVIIPKRKATTPNILNLSRTLSKSTSKSKDSSERDRRICPCLSR